MTKSEFWKLMAFAERECDLSTLRWLEGLGFYYFYYVKHSEECDKWISAFEFFDEEE